MIYTATPVEFEIYDDANELAAKVKMFDSGAANVEIRTALDRRSFDALVPSIQQALSAMKLEGDV